MIEVGTCHQQRLLAKLIGHSFENGGGYSYKSNKNRRVHHMFSFLNVGIDSISTTETHSINGIPSREEDKET